MTLSRDSPSTDRPPGWTSWSISLAIHASLLVVLLYCLRPPTVRGAAEEQTRTVGIALKQLTDEGPQFASEADQSPASTAHQQNDAATEQMLAALPGAAEIPSTADALPQMPALGPGSLSESSANQVGQLASGGPSQKNITNKTTVSIFGLSGTGARFVYVFDRSISMAGAPLRAAKQQLIASLDSLDSVHQFQIVFFNHEPQSWDLTGGQGRIAFATDANKRLAEKFVRGVSATGGTFRRTALQLALRLRPDVIFFLTDTDDPMESADLAEAIRRANRDGIAINTIEYGNTDASVGENFLVQLARETGGRYVYVDTRKLGR